MGPVSVACRDQSIFRYGGDREEVTEAPLHYLAGLDVEVLDQELSPGAVRDVVVVSEGAVSGVDPTARPPPLGVVSVGGEEVDLEAPGPGGLVTVGPGGETESTRTGNKM